VKGATGFEFVYVVWRSRILESNPHERVVADPSNCRLRIAPESRQISIGSGPAEKSEEEKGACGPGHFG
jgi:hypothetical protein